MAKPEILAPAGGREQLYAAVRCGADAVYLGGKGFNARRNAENFDGLGLDEAVRYCHQNGVRVYVTVNTLVMDSELPALESEAAEIVRAGADRVILQDTAALTLFRERYPSLHRVASTQTAVHNTDGARFLQDCGFDSFVLARELSLTEIEKICSAVSIPAEAFVHGAHCMCLSGACELSAMLGGRSGNRGLCAQPCRLDWKCGEREYALSLRDMSLIRHVGELESAGVATLKIEGRMKRPEYVAAAVTACRKALAGEPFDEDGLQAVFSRSGFTDGYLTGRLDRDMFGWRRKEDVTGAESVLKGLAGLYHKPVARVPVSMELSVNPTGSSLTVSDGKNTAAAAGAVPEPAVNRPLDSTTAEKSLKKTGGTQYYVNSFSARIQPGLSLPASALNAMRRESLEKLDELRGAVRHIPETPFNFIMSTHIRSSRQGLWARFYAPEQITGENDLERILLPAEAVDRAVIDRLGDKLTAQLPTLLFPGDEAALERRLSDLKAAGLSSVWTDNIYGILLGKRLGLTVHGGFGLNVMNTPALDFFQKQRLATVTVSFELSMGGIAALGGDIPRGLAAYGRLPLMQMRSCPVRAFRGCSACGGRGELTDRKGIVFPVECGNKRYSTLLNSVPLDISRREAPVDFRVLWFTGEEKGDCTRVIDAFRHKKDAALPHTGGLYYRELL